MKFNKKDYYITMLVFVFLSLFLITALWWVQDNSKVSASCSFHGIELINVSPNTCHFDFEAEFCPVPKDISCDFEIQGIGKLITNMIINKFD